MTERLEVRRRWLAAMVFVAFAAGWAGAAWSGSGARAQAPLRVRSFRYECERVGSSETSLGEPVFRDEHPIVRALRARDDAGWELVSASEAQRSSTLLCFRRPR